MRTQIVVEPLARSEPALNRSGKCQQPAAKLVSEQDYGSSARSALPQRIALPNTLHKKP